MSKKNANEIPEGFEDFQLALQEVEFEEKKPDFDFLAVSPEEFEEFYGSGFEAKEINLLN